MLLAKGREARILLEGFICDVVTKTISKQSSRWKTAPAKTQSASRVFPAKVVTLHHNFYQPRDD
jgi:hypothetical protein